MSLRGLQVDLRVELIPAWRASDRAQIYTDFGSGTIDTDNPLLKTPAALFPDDPRDRVANAGYGEEPYGRAPYGHERAVSEPLQGYGGDQYGEVIYGGQTRTVVIPVQIPQAYGSWKFAAQAVDGAGNLQGALSEFTQFVSGEDPPVLASFAFSSYDSGSDKVTFTFSL